MSLNDQIFDWGNFYQAYTGLKFSIHKENDCRVFVPTYTNISNIPTMSGGTMGTSGTTGVPVIPTDSGTEMKFRDEWSSQSFLIDGDTEYIDDILLRQLWEYADNNILWDEFKQQLSFKDIEVEEITLQNFVKDIDTFLVFHKLSKFGDVWWASRITTDGFNDNSRNTNVTLSTTPGLSGNGNIEAKMFEFWSPDKYVNDEYKKYLSDPSLYNGFLTNSDFLNGGWFTIPDLTISTKPFEKLKIANILLNLKFTFDPENNFGHYYTIKNVLGARIKDGTSTTILDESQTKNDNNNIFWSDNLISHWVGGLISTDNIQNFGTSGNFENDSCQTKSNQINYELEDENDSEISHLIESQITLKPDYDSSQRDFLGTIDPINWRSTDLEDNVHEIGILNIDRAFGGANGTRDNGIIAGGITTNEYNDIPMKTRVLSNAELWSGNGFLKNILPTLNSPRCYHVQGGNGRSTCGVIGGYSEFNVDNPKEFSEWSKATPLDSLEVFIGASDPSLSYFQTVSDLQLNIPRGDHAGNLSVESYSRQDKFEIESLIKDFDLIEDNEQVILEFVNDLSGETSNYIRYALSNVEGFVYGGTTTGRSNLISRAEESYVNINGIKYDEVVDIFEKINTTYLVASENTLSTSNDNSLIIDAPQEIIKDMINIEGTSPNGIDISVDKCGKYRLEYINGGFHSSASANISGDSCQSIVYESVSVDMGDSTGTSISVPSCGYYRATLLNSTLSNNNSGDERVIEETISIPGWDETGTIATLPYAGTYRIEGIEFSVEDPDENNPCYAGGTSVDSSDTNGTDIVMETCGLFRFTYAGGSPVVNQVLSGGSTIDYYACNVTVTVNGSAANPTFYDALGVPTSWDQCFGDLTSFNSFFGGLSKPYFEFCVNASVSSPVTVNVKFDDPCDDDLSNNNGNVNFGISWQGIQSCPCNQSLQQVEVIINDNLNGIAFTSSDEYSFCVTEPDSELRLRYKDDNYSNNSEDYGSVVVKLIYEDADCISSGNPGGVKIFSDGLYVDTIFNEPGDLTTLGTTDNFCVNNPDSDIKFVGDGLWGGQVNFELCYIGQNSICNCRTDGITGRWASNTAISINGQSSEYAFDVQEDSLIDLETYIESRPSDKIYDFCVSESGSVITISPGLEISYPKDAGSVNARLIYLGESNCNCDDSLSNLSTDNVSVESREVTIKYVTVDPNLRYPLRCHGMVYTGDNDSGISTGGRTEYNNMGGSDGVIKRIFDKYSTGYTPIVSNTLTNVKLEKDRVLDLVYELNDQTWIRRQNMLESVYWHCGVGDENRSIFWGGIHDSIGSFEVNVNSISASTDSIDPDEFLCPDDVKTFEKNNISLAGTDYVEILSGGPCWESPIWETFDVSLLFSDPRFRDDQETLQYSNSDNYPNFNIITVAPTNPAPIAPQDETNVTVNHNLGTTIISLNKNVITGGTFRANAKVTDTENTTTGTIQIKEVDITIRTDTTPVYPDDIISITSNNKEFEVTNVQVFQDLSVEMSYRFEETMIYDSSTESDKTYMFAGVGIMKFQSMESIYQDIKNGETSTAISHTFKVLQSSENTTPLIMDGIVGDIKFDITFEDGIMIGVTTKEQEWRSSLSDCGPNISSFIELVADFTPIGNQRWGVPIWTQGLYEDVGTFNLSSDINRRDVSSDTNYGSTYFETSTINISSNNYGSLLNGRILLNGNTTNQTHEYTALNNATISISGETDCISASSNVSITFPMSATSESYTEWGTSFIQEYQNDQRYKAPKKWVQSNGLGISPSKLEIDYENISWKRYMDGVGLGGDVPVYDSIYNPTLKKIRNVTEWSEMNKWHIGQMCFGEPDASIIVGGHKVDSNISITGISNGYHSGETTPRVFVWDLRDIPEEDEFLKNYMGRRLHTQYPKDGEIYAGNSENVLSSLSVNIYQAESDIIVERHGSVLFDNTSEATVEFDTPFSDDISDGNYQISLTPSDNVEVWWENKTNSGFTIFTEIDNFSGSVDYVANAIINVTEKDISENSPLDGYIFDK